MATPNTNLIFKVFGNGIRDVKDGRFFPFKTGSFTALTQVLKGEMNVRYFIHRIVVTGSSLATDSGTSIAVTGVLDMMPVTLANYIKTTLLVNQFSQEFDCDILLDKQSDVNVVAPNITSIAVQITWAEVDDLG